MNQAMKSLIEFLQGKKTYLVTVLAGVYAALVGLGALPSYEIVWGLLGTTAVATLRAGITKAQEEK